jgi:imidazolonepropionase-like amidohydrolase
MRVALERRAERKRREERLEFVIDKIKTESQKLQQVATEIAQELRNKNHTAATLINAVARGFLGRLVASELRLQRWAALKVRSSYNMK